MNLCIILGLACIIGAWTALFDDSSRAIVWSAAALVLLALGAMS